MIFSCFFAAVNQMTDPRFRRVLFFGVFWAVVLLISISAIFGWLLSTLIPESIYLRWVGDVSFIDNLVGWGAAITLMFLSVFLMVPVASVITSFILDRVAHAVEEEFYQALGPAPEVPFLESLRDSIKFFALMIGINLFALVFYLLVPLAFPLVFWILNGFLLGREYFTLAAIRRVGPAQAKVLHSRYILKIWIAGFLMAIPLSVPLLNLIIPILGAATFTHLFHRLAPQAPYGQTSPDP